MSVPKSNFEGYLVLNCFASDFATFANLDAIVGHRDIY